MSAFRDALREEELHDATVHAFLKMQEMAHNEPDIKVAILLIRKLVEEKKTYFDEVVRLKSLTIEPVRLK